MNSVEQANPTKPWVWIVRFVVVNQLLWWLGVVAAIWNLPPRMFAVLAAFIAAIVVLLASLAIWLMELGSKPRGRSMYAYHVAVLLALNSFSIMYALLLGPGTVRE